MTQKGVVTNWGRDRAEFKREADRHNDLSAFVEKECQ